MATSTPSPGMTVDPLHLSLQCNHVSERRQNPLELNSLGLHDHCAPLSRGAVTCQCTPKYSSVSLSQLCSFSSLYRGDECVKATASRFVSTREERLQEDSPSLHAPTGRKTSHQNSGHKANANKSSLFLTLTLGCIACVVMARDAPRSLFNSWQLTFVLSSRSWPSVLYLQSHN